MGKGSGKGRGKEKGKDDGDNDSYAMTNVERPMSAIYMDTNMDEDAEDAFDKAGDIPTNPQVNSIQILFI